MQQNQQEKSLLESIAELSACTEIRCHHCGKQKKEMLVKLEEYRARKYVCEECFPNCYSKEDKQKRFIKFSVEYQPKFWMHLKKEDDWDGCDPWKQHKLDSICFSCRHFLCKACVEKHTTLTTHQPVSFRDFLQQSKDQVLIHRGNSSHINQLLLAEIQDKQARIPHFQSQHHQLQLAIQSVDIPADVQKIIDNRLQDYLNHADLTKQKLEKAIAELAKLKQAAVLKATELQQQHRASLQLKPYQVSISHDLKEITDQIKYRRELMQAQRQRLHLIQGEIKNIRRKKMLFSNIDYNDYLVESSHNLQLIEID